MREQTPSLTPALSLSEGEGAVAIPSPLEGERVRVRGSAGREGRVHEWVGRGREIPIAVSGGDTRAANHEGHGVEDAAVAGHDAEAVATGRRGPASLK